MAAQKTTQGQSDIAFAHIVANAVQRAGYRILGEVRSPWLLVAISPESVVGLVCTRLSGIISRETVDAIFKLSKQRLQKVALVHPHPMSEKYKERAQKAFGVDSVPITGLKAYLDDWRQIIEDTSDAPFPIPPPAPKPVSKRATPAKGIKANADAIIVMVRSLAIQIDSKLAALRSDRPNSREKIAARDETISEYEELRKRVADLEQAVLKLKQPHPKTTEVVKAGTTFGNSISKWWSKSSGKVLDKSADMGIVLSSAGVLALIGVNPGAAAAIAAAVVAGRSMAGVKSSVGH